MKEDKFTFVKETSGTLRLVADEHINIHEISDRIELRIKSALRLQTLVEENIKHFKELLHSTDSNGIQEIIDNYEFMLEYSKK